MKTLSKLDSDKLQEIYTNKKFRNEVANAHACLDQFHKFKYRKTCSYPHEYIVTDEQIDLAKREREASKQRTIEENKGKLVMIGMGMVKDDVEEDFINNHRVRGYFYNTVGRKCFIEAMTSIKGDMFIDFAFYAEGEDACNRNRLIGLDKKTFPGMEFTLTNLLDLVNKSFKCEFNDIVIDNYDLSPDEITSDFHALTRTLTA